MHSPPMACAAATKETVCSWYRLPVGGIPPLSLPAAISADLDVGAGRGRLQAGPHPVAARRRAPGRLRPVGAGFTSVGLKNPG